MSKCKAYKRLNILRSFILPLSTLEQLYTAYIRPILEYADIIKDNCTQQEARELENLQLEAARIVTGGQNVVIINFTSGWDSLQTGIEITNLSSITK
jgi:hypothetical protein